MVQDIRVRAEEIIRTFDTFQSDRRLRIQNMFGWLPPRWPYYKLNSDGARKRSSFAGADGLIRDATGRWHDGFCMNIRICYVTIAELWGLYQGLVLAWVKDCWWLRLIAFVLLSCLTGNALMLLAPRQ